MKAVKAVIFGHVLILLFGVYLSARAAEVFSEDFEAYKVGDNPPGNWKYAGWIGMPGPNAFYKVVADGAKGKGLHCYSKGTSQYIYSGRRPFSPGNDVSLDIKPDYLSWAWKAIKLPPGGDERKQSTADAALGIMLDFGDGTTLGYKWSTTIPVGTIYLCPWAPQADLNMKEIVVEYGAKHLNEWVWANRNVVEDYTNAWGKPPKSNIASIRILTDSDNTNTESECYLDELKPVPLAVTDFRQLSTTWGKIKTG
jgi:hypothetical protein